MFNWHIGSLTPSMHHHRNESSSSTQHRVPSVDQILVTFKAIIRQGFEADIQFVTVQSSLML